MGRKYKFIQPCTHCENCHTLLIQQQCPNSTCCLFSNNHTIDMNKLNDFIESVKSGETVLFEEKKERAVENLKKAGLI